MVPEPSDEAQEAAEEGAGRAEDSRGAGEVRGQLQRERTERQERGGAETRAGAGLVPAGRGKRRRCGYRGRRLLPGSSTIVGCGGVPEAATLTLYMSSCRYTDFLFLPLQIYYKLPFKTNNKGGIQYNVNIYSNMQSGPGDFLQLPFFLCI